MVSRGVETSIRLLPMRERLLASHVRGKQENNIFHTKVSDSRLFVAPKLGMLAGAGEKRQGTFRRTLMWDNGQSLKS